MSKEPSRREFLALSAAALAAAQLGAQTPERRLFAYVGRRTRGGFGSGAPGAGAPGGGRGGGAAPGGGGVTVFRVNMSDGSLTEVSKTGPEVDDLNCDGMCTSADGRLLYAVNQTTSLGGRPGA